MPWKICSKGPELFERKQFLSCVSRMHASKRMKTCYFQADLLKASDPFRRKGTLSCRVRSKLEDLRGSSFTGIRILNTIRAG